MLPDPPRSLRLWRSLLAPAALLTTHIDQHFGFSNLGSMNMAKVFYFCCDFEYICTNKLLKIEENIVYVSHQMKSKHVSPK